MRLCPHTIYVGYNLAPHCAQNALSTSITAAPHPEQNLAVDTCRGNRAAGSINGRAGSGAITGCAGDEGGVGTPGYGPLETWTTFVMVVFWRPNRLITTSMDPTIIMGMPNTAPIIVKQNNNPSIMRIKPTIRVAINTISPLPRSF